MARIIRDRALVEDEWRRLSDDETLPEADAIIVSWQRWLDERDALAARGAPLGVEIDGTVDAADVAADLEHFELIALAFPVFKDGRCYSHARLLRERYGFSGELRAVGDVLRDQLFYMERVGIDSFALRDDLDPHQALSAFEDFSVVYQRALDAMSPQPRWRRAA